MSDWNLPAPSQDAPVVTWGDLPRGTVISIGHPANKRWVIKGFDGEGRSVDTGAPVDLEDLRAGWEIISRPGYGATYEVRSGWTSHGHPVPGLAQVGSPAAVARCGGPALCEACGRETALATAVRDAANTDRL